MISSPKRMQINASCLFYKSW